MSSGDSPCSELQITVLLPAFNEELSVGETLREYAEYFPKARFVVIDNNSSDRTAAVAGEVIGTLGLDGHVLFEGRQGKANAIRCALGRFTAHIWVMVDADATYPAKDMLDLVNAMLAERFDHGVADRLSARSYTNLPGTKTTVHRIGNHVFTKLTSFLTRTTFTDVLSGGRVLSMPFVATLHIESEGFQLETELNMHASEVQALTQERSTSYRRRIEANPSKLSTLRDGWHIVRFIAHWALIKKPDALFFLVAVLLFVPGFWLGLRLVDIYLTTGSVPYASSAVASSVFIASSLQLALFGGAINVFRGFRKKALRKELMELRRRWNEDLDRVLGRC